MFQRKITNLNRDIKIVKILLVIYGVVAFLYVGYFIYSFLSHLGEILSIPLLVPPIMTITFFTAITFMYIIGALKEFSSVRQLRNNTSDAARTGIIGQILIGIPGVFFVFNVGSIEYRIGYLGTLAIPIIWILYNTILYSNLRLLKKHGPRGKITP